MIHESPASPTLPTADFSQCHRGILRQLDALADLAALGLAPHWRRAPMPLAA